MRNNLLLTGMFCLTLPAIAAAQSAARGQYIVERVGMCADCHTPRDEKGELIHSKALQGFEIGSRPIHPRPWADYAPPIAGLPAHFSPEQMVKFLETGIRPDGSVPRPPMPPYRLSHEDAQSVTAWLNSLKN
jgi:Cytochrome C oxidase, cbb3-type, subunit III